MLEGDVDPANVTPATLLETWCDRLDGRPDMTLAEASTRIAADHPTMTEDEIGEELRDRLRIALINAVLDVDTLAGRLELDLSGTDLRERIEGTSAMTLREYAYVRHAVAGVAT